jgi:prepilin-type N-terminal cleavage/methylation domain-containing protein
MKNRAGFTIVELLIAVMVLSVGLLALLGSSTLSSKTIGKSRRVDFASTHAGRRLELLRASACTSQTAGADTLFRGASVEAINAWSFVDAGNSTFRIYLTTTYLVSTQTNGILKQDVLKTSTAVSCLN